jgi:hypothetical protein
MHIKSIPNPNAMQVLSKIFEVIELGLTGTCRVSGVGVKLKEQKVTESNPLSQRYVCSGGGKWRETSASRASGSNV